MSGGLPPWFATQVNPDAVTAYTHLGQTFDDSPPCGPLPSNIVIAFQQEMLPSRCRGDSNPRSSVENPPTLPLRHARGGRPLVIFFIHVIIVQLTFHLCHFVNVQYHDVGL
ncbi:Uncharacterized protein Fot_18318 [Forsythia ovata]|uniref:Uncharacterized protein n=1 Tax=Forsythia ovata TaxID=205694 RepID=A0ABD1VHW8_9LAMI